MSERELDPQARYERLSEEELLTSVVLLAFRSGEQERAALLRATVAAVAALVRLAQPTGAALEVLSLVEGWVTGEIGDAELRAPVWSAQVLDRGALGLLVLARLGLVSNPHLLATLQQVLDWLASTTAISGSAEAAQAVRRAVPYALLERAASAWTRACEVSER